MNASFRRPKFLVLRACLRIPAVVLLVLTGEAMLTGAQAFSLPPRTGDWQHGFTMILMNHTGAAAANQARDFVTSRGGRIALLVPPHLMLGWVTSALSQELIVRSGIEMIVYHPIASSELTYDDQATLSAVSFFNAVVSGALAAEQAAVSQEGGEPLSHDALAPPLLDEEAYAENLRAFGMAPAAGGNSENMTGIVAVALLFVESNGAIDPNTYTWRADDQQNTFNRALSGLTWWADQASAFGHSLTFSVSFYSATHAAVQQGYEPILHAGSEDNLWIEAIMANLGFDQGEKIARVTAFNTWLKNNLGADWAYTAFIGYNPPPAPARFSDGYFAYAHLGGPFTHVLFKNDGWAVEDFGKIFSHETGHIFWACDEYFQPGYGGCVSCGPCAPSGPRPTAENGNCEVCNASARECMMRLNSPLLCTFTPYQIGWRGNCAYTVAPTTRPHGPEAGSGVVNVFADPGCEWTALSLSSWIAVTLGQGSGNGSVSYEIEANSGPGARTGYLNIAGRVFTIQQEGSACVAYAEDFEDGAAQEWQPLSPQRWEIANNVGSLRYFLNTTDYDSPDEMLMGSDGSRPVTKLYRNNAQTPNTRPSPPSLNSAAVKDNRVVLAWSGANDQETTGGLTYNVRVGLTPGGAEILSPQSLLTTGQRLVPRLGNASQAFSATIRNLPDGTYYWSVQAIDNGFAASEFAPEQAFTLPACVNHGDINNDGVLTPGDALCAFHIYLTGVLPRDCDAPGSECEIVASDVNCDAATTPGDALAIFRRYLDNLPPAACFGRSALPKNTTPHRLILQTRRIMSTHGSQTAEQLRVAIVLQNPAGLSAFGMRLGYPTDKLAFLSVRRTALTAEWMQFEAVLREEGDVVLGGFHTEPLTAQTSGEISELIFAIKSQALDALELEMRETSDDLSHAVFALESPGGALIAVPQVFELHQSFPNPFVTRSEDDEALIRFDLPGTASMHVALGIYDVTGRLVRRLVSAVYAPGAYETRWDGRNERGVSVPSGTYVYRLQAGSQMASRKLNVVR